MNLGNGKGSVSAAGSSGGWRPAEAVSDQFPAGLRVLVVDDDPTCLRILEKMLTTCLYEVTKCSRAEMALSLLRNNKNGYDIVLSDVHMPDMDGFKLLEHIGLEMDLPVIMMSVDDGKNVVMKGVTHGACDYLIKPVRMEALRNIWQHVVRKKRNEWKEMEQSGSIEEGKQSDDPDYSSSVNEGNWRNSKKRKEEDDEADELDDSSTLKKPRVVWSVELHQQFVQAVNQLGIDKAVPKRILELMNVPGLTRENVASHLQKYRLYLRRLSGVSQNPNNGYMISPQEAAYNSLSALNGLDLQSLASLQAAARPPARIPDQRNPFFESPKPRFENNNQMNLLHGIPTNMEPKQLGNLQMNLPPQNNPLQIQMSQSSSRGSGGLGGSGHPSPMGQPVLPRTGLVENGRGTGQTGQTGYNSMMNFPLNNAAELSGTSFQMGSAKGQGQGEINSGIKGSVGFMPSYDIFSDLDNAGMTFNGGQPGLLSNQRTGQNNNLSGVSRPMFSAGEAPNQCIGQNMNNFFGSNSMRVKSEFVPDANLFTEQFDQDDLMSALLKQQQGNVGTAENEFDFDGYSLDNVPV